MKKILLILTLMFTYSIISYGEHQAIHIFVALCNNKYQGIVKVPEAIGNGQDPRNNLYWGALYGIKTHFNKSREWDVIKSEKVDAIILERIVFKHANKEWYIVADAYDGRYMKDAIKDFSASSSGEERDFIEVNDIEIGIKGNAKMLAFIGHNGLMDFSLSEPYKNQDEITRDVIILACYSKSYFSEHLKEANINPLLWTTGLMAPEAYTIHDAISVYINGENSEKIREKGAAAYSKYQKCSLQAAKNLLVTGW